MCCDIIMQASGSHHRQGSRSQSQSWSRSRSVLGAACVPFTLPHFIELCSVPRVAARNLTQIAASLAQN